ncbi:MAG: alanine:cation symporter family protein, partial [Clostridia bacterium]|nr:alanine:cation symporter family protein [Clostridia bacterium]
CAFTPESAAGGAIGTCFTAALRQGTLKGCFSHEAGSGTAVFAHTHAGASAEKQACFGIVEVFFDTTVVCSLTAFAVMASGVDYNSFGYSGTECVLGVFGAALGTGAVKAVSLCIALFAFATVLCWSSYGLTALRYLTPSRLAGRIYLVIYCAAAFSGSLIKTRAVWMMTDASVLLLTLLNLVTVMRRRGEICPPDLP